MAFHFIIRFYYLQFYYGQFNVAYMCGSDASISCFCFFFTCFWIRRCITASPITAETWIAGKFLNYFKSYCGKCPINGPHQVENDCSIFYTTHRTFTAYQQNSDSLWLKLKCSETSCSSLVLSFSFSLISDLPSAAYRKSLSWKQPFNFAAFDAQ